MFHVHWHHSALDELANAWLLGDSALRKAITAANFSIDLRLQIDPLNEGESRPRNRRLAFFAPLAVIFEVNAATSTVTILHVQLFGKRKK